MMTHYDAIPDSVVMTHYDAIPDLVMMTQYDAIPDTTEKSIMMSHSSQTVSPLAILTPGRRPQNVYKFKSPPPYGRGLIV